LDHQYCAPTCSFSHLFSIDTGAVLSIEPTRGQREAVLDWFSGRPRFEKVHALEALIVDDWV